MSSAARSKSSPIADVVEKYGYRRTTRRRFHKDAPDALGVIQLQRAQAADKFTVNLGIFLPSLNPEIVPAEVECWDCHWQERLGFFAQKPDDYWWPIDSEEEPSLILEKALPELDRLLSKRALVEYWKSGGYGGLTEAQRRRFLDAAERAN